MRQFRRITDLIRTNLFRLAGSSIGGCTYLVRANPCSCTQKACICNPWHILTPEKDVLVTCMDKKDAEEIAETMNLKRRKND